MACKTYHSMKTIRTLQILINLLFYALVIVLSVTTVYYLILFIYPDILPYFLQVSRMAFNYVDWTFYIVPVFTYINFILFILGVYLMKKTIPSFKKADFYSDVVINNLKKSGKLFLFIGLSMTALKLIILIVLQNTLIFKGQVFKGWWNILFSIIGTIDFAMVCLVILGLFLLIFSDSFKRAKEIQQENNLTI